MSSGTQVWIPPPRDGARTHAAFAMGPRTLCGKPIEHGWRQDIEVRAADESTVECRRCRKALLSSSDGSAKR